ncbi:Hemicentin-2 [Schistosoma japonicum]|nr:Hemicentin-2 [Schistosoma japonicum]
MSLCMDHIIQTMWISFLLFTGQNYADTTDKLFQSSLSTSYNMKYSQYSAYNETIEQGEQITLHCLPESNTNFIIWYFTPMITKERTFNEQHELLNQDVSYVNITMISETIELAVCKPQITCKEQIHLIDIQVYSNGILTITNAQSYHSGNYQCAMLAGVKTVTMNRYLIVQVPPGKPIITINPSKLDRKSIKDPYIMEGEYLSLTCRSAKGLPPPQIFWLLFSVKNTTTPSEVIEAVQDSTFLSENSYYKRNNNIESLVYMPSVRPYGITSSDLRLKVLRSHDGMRISCKAVNKITSNAPVILQFSSEPWIVLYEELSTMECRALGNPPPTIYWIDQHGKRISKTELLNSGLLNKILFQDDFHKFSKDNWRMNVTCYAMNVIGIAPIIRTNKIVYARSGESVRLSCDAVSNPPPINVFWYRKSHEFTFDKSRQVNTNNLIKSIDNIIEHKSTNSTSNKRLYWSSPMLHINSVTIDDAGIYECAAENVIKLANHDSFIYRRESQTQLLVYYPPVPGLPTPSIEWLWYPQSCKTMTSISTNFLLPIPFKKKYSESDNQLLINQTGTFIDGLYYCLVQNDHGNSLSDPVNITVQEPPQIIEGPNIDNILHPSFSSTSTPYLRCVARGKPAPQINWIHDDSVIHITAAPTTTMNSLGDQNNIHCSWRSIFTNVKCIEYETGSYTWETTSELVWGYSQATESLLHNQSKQNVSQSNNVHKQCHSFHIMNEGIYKCQAMNEFDPPILLHELIIKQTFNYQLSLYEVNKQLFNSTIFNPTRLTCLFQANPSPYQITWFYMPIHLFTVYSRKLHRTSCPQLPSNHLTLISVYKMDQNELEHHKGNKTFIELLSGNHVKLVLTNELNINIDYVDSLYLTNLIINEMNLIKVGVYMSTIVNSEGCQQCIILLQNHSIPDTPTNIEIKEVTWDKLTLGWIPGFNGGYEQTIVIEFLKVSNQQYKETTVKSLPKEVIISHVPKLPIHQHCQISGLSPNTTYTFVIYGKNQLGNGPKSKEYTFTTKELHFPKLVITNHSNNSIKLNFTHQYDSKLFCLKTEFLQVNHMNWITSLDTCSNQNEILSSSSLNKQLINHFNVTVKTIPRIHGNGRIDYTLKASNTVMIDKSIDKQHYNNDNIDVLSSIKHSQANSDDPKSIEYFQKNKIKSGLNKTMHNEYDSAQHNFLLHMNQSNTYRIWICLRNQTTICHQENLSSQDLAFNPNIYNFQGTFSWIVVIVIVLFSIICIILIVVYIKRCQTINIPNDSLIHKKDNHFMQSNDNLSVNMRKLNGSLPQSTPYILNNTIDNTNIKLSTSSLTITESNYSTPSTFISLPCDITHNPISLMSFNHDLHDSLNKTSTIELTPAYIEYTPTSIDLCTNNPYHYSLSSTCSLIPLSTHNLCDNDKFASIPKCIVNSPSIVIIPANTFSSVQFQCSTDN